MLIHPESTVIFHFNNSGMKILDTAISLSNIGWDEIALAAVGYTVVFLALVVLFIVFYYLSKVLTSNLRKRLKRQGKEINPSALEVTGEVNAAISMALFMYFNELHDEEPGELTIKKISRRYSPWNSKIYGVMYNRLSK